MLTGGQFALCLALNEPPEKGVKNIVKMKVFKPNVFSCLPSSGLK